jgi:diadenosine tetraphosphate (Ap4A) HIT family hydrolase
MKKCVFCDIVKRKIPSNIVYEDNLVIAILDINSVSVGHTLIMPKRHFENIYDIPEEELKRITQVLKKILLHYRKRLNINECNILNASGKNAQQTIFHFHIHLVPRKEGDGLNLWDDTNKKAKLDLEDLTEKIGKLK